MLKIPIRFALKYLTHSNPMTHEKTEKVCKTCGKSTKYMYRMNDGLYCDEHKEAALLNQKTKLFIESFKERLVSPRWGAFRN